MSRDPALHLTGGGWLARRVEGERHRRLVVSEPATPAGEASVAGEWRASELSEALGLRVVPSVELVGRGCSRRWIEGRTWARDDALLSPSAARLAVFDFIAFTRDRSARKNVVEDAGRALWAVDNEYAAMTCGLDEYGDAYRQVGRRTVFWRSDLLELWAFAPPDVAFVDAAVTTALRRDRQAVADTLRRCRASEPAIVEALLRFDLLAARRHLGWAWRTWKAAAEIG